MTPHQRPGRIVFKLVIVAVLLAVLGGGVFLLHRHRKEVAARRAREAGEAAWKSGQYTQAAVQLGKYLAADRRNPEVLFTYAQAQVRRRPPAAGSVQQAISALETIIRLGHWDQPLTARAARMLSQELYLAIGDLGGAERVARAWAQALPRDPQAAVVQASVLAGRRQAAEAMEALRAVLRDHPGNVEAASLFAVLSVQGTATAPATAAAATQVASTRPAEPRLAEANRVLDAAVAAAPGQVAPLVKRAEFRLLTRQLPLVRADLDAADKCAAAEPADIVQLGRLYAEVGDLDRAVAAFERAAVLAPDDPAPWAAWGQALLDAGRAAEGAALADRFDKLPLGERSYDLLPLAVELYCAAGRTKDADERVAALRTRGAPADLVGVYDAAVLIAKGRPYPAIAGLEEIARRTAKDPKAARYPRADLLLARAHTRTGNPGRAIECYREYLRAPDAPSGALQARLELAALYAAQGRWSEAAQVSAEAAGLFPWKSAAALLSMEMQAGAARPKGTQPNPALLRRLRERMQPIVQAAPDDLRVQTLYARVTAWSGQDKEAAAILQALAARVPAARVPALLTQSELASEAGRMDEALARCREAIDAADPAEKPALQARLVELQLAGGDTAAAEALAAQVEQSAADPATLVRVAQSLLRGNQPDRARALLARAAGQDPKDLRSRLQLLYLATRPADAPSRQELVEQVRAIETEQQHGQEWRYWQARIWMEADDWKDRQAEIESQLKAVIAESSYAHPAALALAVLYEKAGRSEAALDVYQKAFDADPANLQAAERLVVAAGRAGRWAEVDRVLGVVPPDRPEFESHRIARALRQGDAGLARRMLEDRVQADPADARSRLQLARLDLSTGDVAGAQRLFDEAARIAPDDADVLIARVQLHLLRREWDRAIALCDERLARGPSPEALSLRATAHAAASRPAEAEKDLRAVAATKGWEERGLLAIGQLYAQGGDTQKALDSWKAALATVPGSLSIQRAMAAALLAGSPEQRREGMDLLTALLKEHGSDVQLLGLRAETLLRTNPAEAEKDYLEIVQRDPAAAGAFLRLAGIARGRGQREGALAWIDKGLAGSPSDVSLLLAKSDLLRDTDAARSAAAARQAVAAAQSLLYLQPGSQMLAVALAEARGRAGQRDEAVQALRQFLAGAEGAKAVEPRLVLGRMLIEGKDFAQADEWIRQAAELAPADPGPVQVRLEWLARQARWADLVAAAETWRKGHPEDFTVCGAAGEWLLRSPDPAQAIPFLEAITEKFPGQPEAKKAIALAHYQAGRIPQAVELLQKAVVAHPANVGLANNLAWMLCEDLKKPDEAARVAEPVVKSGAADPEYPFLLDTWGVVQYRLGVAAKSAGRAAEANRYFQESRTRLEECRRDTRADPMTRAGAALHLARTLAESDSAAAGRVIRELLDDKPALSLLSEKEQAEAKALADRLSAPTARAR